ncbi:MAG: hypothetical protein O7F73_19700 [Gammaproteobacteria bacterium]|nr:hypothetical protein [Gammaproteobacteria bacterium]
MAGSLLLILLTRLDLNRPGGTFAQARIRCLGCHEGLWRLELDSGECVAIFPRSDSLVLPWLVVLRARVEPTSRSCTVVLTGDAFPAECWRRLQLNLRQTLSVSSG